MDGTADAGIIEVNIINRILWSTLRLGTHYVLHIHNTSKICLHEAWKAYQRYILAYLTKQFTRSLM